LFSSPSFSSSSLLLLRSLLKVRCNRCFASDRSSYRIVN